MVSVSVTWKKSARAERASKRNLAKKDPYYPYKRNPYCRRSDGATNGCSLEQARLDNPEVLFDSDDFDFDDEDEDEEEDEEVTETPLGDGFDRPYRKSPYRKMCVKFFYVHINGNRCGFSNQELVCGR